MPFSNIASQATKTAYEAKQTNTRCWKTRQTLKKIEEKQEKLKKETPKTPVVSSEEEVTDLELHCQMTENLIEPNKVVCVNSFYVILLKFTFVLSGEKETWSKLTAFLVCVQSYFVTEGILHIPPPTIIIYTFP